jgi:tetratricopeptide (TPR) repeat protein
VRIVLPLFSALSQLGYFQIPRRPSAGKSLTHARRPPLVNYEMAMMKRKYPPPILRTEPSAVTRDLLLEQAQELIYQAWDVGDRRQRTALARKALKLSADCSDAYVLLAEAAVTPAKALELYRQGVEAGVRVLGSAFFVEERGHFWGLVETRPYMRARAGLARSLWQCGEYDQAIINWNDLLQLNADDNLGIRYVLAARLLELGRDRELEVLLKAHADDGRAFLIWAKALLLFRIAGDTANVRQALAEALASNPHLPAYLLGHKPLPAQLPRYTGLGDEREAAYWAAETNQAWAATPGALAWLAQHTAAAKPTLH